MKAIQTVLLEAVVVGVLLIVIYYILEIVLQKFKLHQIVLLFLAGSLFHLICEFTGVNIWYVKEYSKIL